MRRSVAVRGSSAVGLLLTAHAIGQVVAPHAPDHRVGGVGSVRLSDESTIAAAPHYWLFMADGSRRAVRRFAVHEGALRIWPAVEPGSSGAPDRAAGPGGMTTASPSRGRAGAPDGARPEAPEAPPAAQSTEAESTEAAGGARAEGGLREDRDAMAGHIDVPLGECVAVLCELPIRSTDRGPRAQPFVEFTDGERWPGEPESGPESLTWRHPWLGSRAVSIDEMRRALFVAGGRVPSPAAEDVVLLANGDAIEGMLLSLGDSVVMERSGTVSVAEPAKERLGGDAPARDGADTGENGGDAASERRIDGGAVVGDAAPRGMSGSTSGSEAARDDETPTTAGAGHGHDGRPDPVGVGARSEIRVPFGRVVSVVLVAPLEPSIGPRLWFDDGTVVDAVPESTATAKPGLVAIRHDGGLATPGTTAATTVRVPPGRDDPQGTDREALGTTAGRNGSPLVDTSTIRAFVLSPSQIVPLATLNPESVRSVSHFPTFALSQPEVEDGRWGAQVAPVIAFGATSIRFEAPGPGYRFVAEARPQGFDAEWTSFELVVRDGDREVARHAFGTDPRAGDRLGAPMADRASAAGDRTVWLNVPLSSSSLEIELTEGDRGPLCDALRLEFAMLIAPPPPKLSATSRSTSATGPRRE